MAIDNGKLKSSWARFVADLGATIAAGNVVIGHRLGLYQALAAGPARADELAARTQTSPRYITEWLRGQAAGGYVEYDAATGTYSMTEEQAFALANPDGGVYVPGAFVLALGALKAEPRITERSAPAPAWAGMSTTRTSSSAASSSSGPATSPTWCRRGSRRSTASRTSSAPAPRSPTSAAGSAHRRSCSPGSTRTRPSPARTTTIGPSSSPASGPPTPGSPTG